MKGANVLKQWITTGSMRLDMALNGGLPIGEITLIYGEAETGKTGLAIQCSVNAARIGFKTLYIDCEGAFTPERLSQIAQSDIDEVSEMIIIARPSSFREQIDLIDGLEKYITRRFGLIVFDTITSHYRSEIASRGDTFNLNRELNRQVAVLMQIARTTPLSVLLLSQVRSVMEASDFTPVATRTLRFWSSEVIKLSRTERPNIVRCVVEKVHEAERNLKFLLSIEEDGIHDYPPA
ncbi:hypothetical protein DRO37_04765 [Candidatus Bathyarchaeota archaeon]|nr:MAG: hypothetical protein DRO37_04765 [Candidatus Bathyarchaeota archaeon]